MKNCNYAEYRKLVDQMFYGETQTNEHLNEYTEILRQYLVKGGAGAILCKMGIGIELTTRKLALLPEEIVSKRFIWIAGPRAGKLLDKVEVESIGMEEEDFGVEYVIQYLLPNGKTQTTIAEWLPEKSWNCIYPVLAWHEYAPVSAYDPPVLHMKTRT